jgi:hypothetical protein
MVIGAGIVLAVIAFVAWPMVAGRRRAAHTGGPVDDARIERRITEYREALRRRTVCDSCLYANAAGARFCSECGGRLSGTGDASASA